MVASGTGTERAAAAPSTISVVRATLTSQPSHPCQNTTDHAIFTLNAIERFEAAGVLRGGAAVGWKQKKRMAVVATVEKGSSSRIEVKIAKDKEGEENSGAATATTPEFLVVALVLTRITNCVTVFAKKQHIGGL